MTTAQPADRRHHPALDNPTGHPLSRPQNCSITCAAATASGVEGGRDVGSSHHHATERGKAFAPVTADLPPGSPSGQLRHRWGIQTTARNGPPLPRCWVHTDRARAHSRALLPCLACIPWMVHTRIDRGRVETREAYPGGPLKISLVRRGSRNFAPYRHPSPTAAASRPLRG